MGWILKALDWAEYLPRGFRKAWCEVSGGHDNEVLGCWAGSRDRANYVRLHCFRCDRETRWYQVPTSSTGEKNDG